MVDLNVHRVSCAKPGANIFHRLNMREARTDLRRLWEFLAPQYIVRRNDLPLKKEGFGHAVTTKDILACDTLLLLGSNDERAIATSLLLFRMNPRLMIVCSGKGGHRTVPSQAYYSAEAEINARALMLLGVPYERILIEPESQNTGANIVNSRTLIVAKEHSAKRVIIVQSPAAQLRANLCFERKWNEDFEWEYYISHPPIPPSPATMRPKALEFHLSYALREVSRMINYSYNPRFDYQTKRPVPRGILEIISRYFRRRIILSPDALYKDPILMQSLMEYFGSAFDVVDRACPAN